MDLNTPPCGGAHAGFCPSACNPEGCYSGIAASRSEAYIRIAVTSLSGFIRVGPFDTPCCCNAT